MIYQFVSDKLHYDGTQLQSLYAYMNYGLLGDSIIAFIGGCSVSFEHMVDGEDLRAQSAICGERMLHFIIETFPAHLELAVSRQRLFAAMAHDSLKEVEREGDDLYWKGGKLSISIATVSPVSSLIHFAMNITNEGTPVPTASLSDLHVDARAFADELGARFCREIHTQREACCKVRWVK